MIGELRDDNRKKAMLEMLTHLYNAVEEGKGDILGFSYLMPDQYPITTFGSNAPIKHISSGPYKITIEAELYR